MVYDPNNQQLYPVDKENVNMTTVEEEDLYEIDAEKNILDGIINPRFIRWYNEDNQNDEPVDNSKDLKVRYRTCQLCPLFDQIKKLCDECGCFMPIKVQFKKNSCPLGKWDSITTSE